MCIIHGLDVQPVLKPDTVFSYKHFVKAILELQTMLSSHAASTVQYLHSGLAAFLAF